MKSLWVIGEGVLATM